jgi:hypothetical protein|tara:strand:+ start:499 stop:756 length:258 start_codon:yes stop_codon:yes gene_type:complete
MWNSIKDSKLIIGLLTAYVVAMTGGVINATVVNFGQDTAHVNEVDRSKGVDKKESDRTTFSITLALEAKELAIKNSAIAEAHRHE